ncbi:MAG: LamG domain-containing protein, partial [Patescibacteria group bacterium]
KDTAWNTNKTLDKSGNGNHGTMTNMSTTTAPVAGRIGQGLKFDGVDDTVNVGDPANGSLDFGTGDFAISVWIKFKGYVSQGSTFNSAVGKESTTNTGYGIITDANNVIYFNALSDGSAANMARTAANQNDNKWHHYIGQRVSGLLTLYKDGVRQTDGSTQSDSVSNTIPFQISNDANGNRVFNGLIDDVRVYNRALSASEIKRLYNMGR